MLLQSRIHRILKPLVSYRETDRGDSPDWLNDIHLQNQEVCYGLYENSPIERSQVVVTNLGIHIHEQQWLFLPYDQIEEVRFEGEKTELDNLLVKMIDGDTIPVPIRGGRGRFRDAFEFGRFLDRVANDIRSGRYTP